MFEEGHELDTPIYRAKLTDLPTKDIELFIEDLQKRRLRVQEIYLQAQESKRLAKENKDLDLLLNKIVQFQKKADAVDKGLKALEKYAKEIIGIRLALGHEI
ncbi:MAG: hypothetical protein IM561_09060 [Microcystis sp. M60BS1]|uniref:hypothetical protein n=1 Tax=unclassified Microcystis TaxID=2643300 RepID=UPI00257EC52B|nr:MULTISPECIES: hypothetical protein [unclassified Microcystis]MCA2594359.1 hypothetical protein [Microcystis sp. M38BS1]MCA6581464.1 hypothetical protein [Pseudanabaena sp. M34BS1SP1A06MG]MCA2510518.1 hypothetical protein [Microcystis sp. M60BS1]MCA2555752.1 hypothetical protein [Microcystis sp. M43BS1]MCA2603419.1 hypothetical protein [Microcystis sp. M26BS1]